MTQLRPIVLVEDNLNDVELTLAALKKANLANATVVLRDGAEALDYLYSRGIYKDREVGDPAVVLLDIKLPKVDGIEVLQQIKSDPMQRHLPIVMLTSSREEHDLIRSYDLGVNAFVVKPVEFTEFHTTIKELGLFWGVLNELPPRGRNAL